MAGKHRPDVYTSAVFADFGLMHVAVRALPDRHFGLASGSTASPPVHPMKRTGGIDPPRSRNYSGAGHLTEPTTIASAITAGLVFTSLDGGDFSRSPDEGYCWMNLVPRRRGPPYRRLPRAPPGIPGIPGSTSVDSSDSASASGGGNPGGDPAQQEPLADPARRQWRRWRCPEGDRGYDLAIRQPGRLL